MNTEDRALKVKCLIAASTVAVAVYIAVAVLVSGTVYPPVAIAAYAVTFIILSLSITVDAQYRTDAYGRCILLASGIGFVIAQVLNLILHAS